MRNIFIILSILGIIGVGAIDAINQAYNFAKVYTAMRKKNGEVTCIWHCDMKNTPTTMTLVLSWPSYLFSLLNKPNYLDMAHAIYLTAPRTKRNQRLEEVSFTYYPNSLPTVGDDTFTNRQGYLLRVPLSELEDKTKNGKYQQCNVDTTSKDNTQFYTCDGFLSFFLRTKLQKNPTDPDHRFKVARQAPEVFWTFTIHVEIDLKGGTPSKVSTASKTRIISTECARTCEDCKGRCIVDVTFKITPVVLKKDLKISEPDITAEKMSVWDKRGNSLFMFGQRVYIRFNADLKTRLLSLRAIEAFLPENSEEKAVITKKCNLKTYPTNRKGEFYLSLTVAGIAGLGGKVFNLQFTFDLSGVPVGRRRALSFMERTLQAKKPSKVALTTVQGVREMNERIETNVIGEQGYRNTEYPEQKVLNGFIGVLLGLFSLSCICVVIGLFNMHLSSNKGGKDVDAASTISISSQINQQ